MRPGLLIIDTRVIRFLISRGSSRTSFSFLELLATLRDYAKD